MKKELITKIDAKSPVSEVFRALRTNIQYMSDSSKAQTLLITSTAQGEGKSWVTANLAITFAQAGKDVIIVDSDMRRPRENTIFGVEMFPGLSNYLSGISSRGSEREIKAKDCIRATEIDNLYVMPAGNIPPNPSELLSSGKTKNLINELSRIFDVIIFDGAPCLLVTDSTIISRLVDSTILVASQKTTKTEDLKNAKNQIENVGGHVIGVVLNRVKISSKKYENKYYYSSTSTSMVASSITPKHRYSDSEDVSQELELRQKSKEREEVKTSKYENSDNTKTRTSSRKSSIELDVKGDRKTQEILRQIEQYNKGKED